MTTLRTAALLGVTLALPALAGCGPEQAAEPALAASPAVVRTSAAAPEPDDPGRIPDSVRVDDDLREGGGDFTRDDERGVSAEPCGHEAFPVGPVVDRRTAAVSGPEYDEVRDLRLFADAAQARAFLAAARTRVEACPVERSGGSAALYSTLRSGLADEPSFTVLRTYRNGDLPVLGATWWEVVQVGPAVLLTTTSGEYDPTSNLGPAIEQHAGEVAGIVAALEEWVART